MNDTKKPEKTNGPELATFADPKNEPTQDLSREKHEKLQAVMKAWAEYLAVGEEEEEEEETFAEAEAKRLNREELVNLHE